MDFASCRKLGDEGEMALDDVRIHFGMPMDAVARVLDHGEARRRERVQVEDAFEIGLDQAADLLGTRARPAEQAAGFQAEAAQDEAELAIIAQALDAGQVLRSDLQH